jgi:hypothetical protein
MIWIIGNGIGRFLARARIPNEAQRNEESPLPQVNKNDQKFVLSKTSFTFAIRQNVKMKAINTYWRWWLSIFHFLT